MFDTSPENPRISSYLRFVTAVECSVVFLAAVLLYFLPGLAEDVWAWSIPPFNARFVGAIYVAAYLPLLIFWFVARWTPGRFVLWQIFTFTALIMVTMIVHRGSFAWDRPSTYLVFWPLYIFLPINSAIFLYESRGIGGRAASDLSPAWRGILLIFSLFGGFHGLGLLLAPEQFSAYWPWLVDAFHARIYASAFITPAAGAWILLSRRGAASEHLIFGLNLIAGGFLPILGTLWTNASVSAERQIRYDAGTWIFFIIFILTGLLGIGQVLLAVRKAK
jgi:hypothetical protein